MLDFNLAGKAMELSTLYSEGRDIGKSNSLFPDQRITDYPLERHWLTQLEATFSDSLHGSVFYHDQKLETRVERIGERINEVDTSSYDWGTRLADIAPSRLSLGLQYRTRSWESAVNYDYRFEKSGVSPSELPADSARLLSAKLSRS